MEKHRLYDTVLPLLAATVFSGISLAQTSGDIDATFGVSGYVITDHIPGSGEIFNDLLVLSDDKILMTGFVDDANQDILLAKYNADGTADGTFGNGGKVTIDLTIGADEQGTAAVELSDGKILVTGGMDHGTIDAFVLRLNADGSLDNSFGTGGTGYTILNAGANSLAFGTDVEVHGTDIYVGATVANALANYDFAIFKLTQGGGVDVSFGTSGVALVDNDGANDYVYNLDLSVSGKIVAAGYTDDGDTKGFIVRLTSSGALDLTFNATGGYIYDPTADDETIFDVCFGAGDKVIAVGTQGTGNNIDGAILRLGDDGVPDTGFGTNGVVVSDIGTDNGVFLRRVQVSEHGKIFAGGYVDGLSLRSPYVISLTDNGSADTDFAPGGDAIPDFAIALNGIFGTGLGIQSDGNVLLGGSATSQDFVGDNMYLMRLYGIEAELGVNEQAVAEALVYPNPASERFEIRSDEVIEEVRLMDLNGCLIDSWKFANHYELKENVVSGVYMLHITTTSGSAVHRLSVVR